MLKFIKKLFTKPTPPPAAVAESVVEAAPVLAPIVQRTPALSNVDEVGKMLADKAKEAPIKEAWPFPTEVPAAVVAPIKKQRKPRATKAN
jgi:hypothetical protein